MNALSAKTEYVPLVPYEQSSWSCCAGGLKCALLVMAIFTVASAVFAVLVYTKTIPYNGKEWVSSMCIAGAPLGLMPVVLLCAWKGAYNQIYPQGNWIDFLKRDWNDFLGGNYQHYIAWEKEQK